MGWEALTPYSFNSDRNQCDYNFLAGGETSDYMLLWHTHKKKWNDVNDDGDNPNGKLNYWKSW